MRASGKQTFDRVYQSTMLSHSEMESRAAHPHRNPRVFVALRRIAATGSSAARLLIIPHKVSSLRCGTLRGPRFRGVKMRRCSFTPRFASKTIRSLAHFHDAGDEGNALVVIRRHSHRLQVAAIRGPRRKYFRRGGRKSRLGGGFWEPVPWAVGSRHEGRVGVRGRRRLVRAGREGCRALPSTSRWGL